MLHQYRLHFCNQFLNGGQSMFGRHPQWLVVAETVDGGLWWPQLIYIIAVTAVCNTEQSWAVMGKAWPRQDSGCIPKVANQVQALHTTNDVH
jgi:hypothetical protein